MKYNKTILKLKSPIIAAFFSLFFFDERYQSCFEGTQHGSVIFEVCHYLKYSTFMSGIAANTVRASNLFDIQDLS